MSVRKISQLTLLSLLSVMPGFFSSAVAIARGHNVVASEKVKSFFGCRDTLIQFAQSFADVTGGLSPTLHIGFPAELDALMQNAGFDTANAELAKQFLTAIRGRASASSVVDFTFKQIDRSNNYEKGDQKLFICLPGGGCQIHLPNYGPIIAGASGKAVGQPTLVNNPINFSTPERLRAGAGEGLDLETPVAKHGLLRWEWILAPEIKSPSHHASSGNDTIAWVTDMVSMYGKHAGLNLMSKWVQTNLKRQASGLVVDPLFKRFVKVGQGIAIIDSSFLHFVQIYFSAEIVHQGSEVLRNRFPADYDTGTNAYNKQFYFLLFVKQSGVADPGKVIGVDEDNYLDRGGEIVSQMMKFIAADAHGPQ